MIGVLLQSDSEETDLQAGLFSPESSLFGRQPCLSALKRECPFVQRLQEVVHFPANGLYKRSCDGIEVRLDNLDDLLSGGDFFRKLNDFFKSGDVHFHLVSNHCSGLDRGEPAIREYGAIDIPLHEVLHERSDIQLWFTLFRLVEAVVGDRLSRSFWNERNSTCCSSCRIWRG
jgi:hypothetical protein